MKTSQSELSLNLPAVGGDWAISIGDFRGYLDGLQGWARAGRILAAFQVEDTPGNRRRLRRLASLSGGTIISGLDGYKHIQHAIPGEIRMASNRLEHQAKRMGDRARAIRRQAHKLIF